MTLQDFLVELHSAMLERDWKQFHTAENLAKSISIESGELLQCFQWGQSFNTEEVEFELADVMTYCVLLAEYLGVDIVDLMSRKLAITKEKYPIEKAFGVSSRYDELPN